ncbi:MAG: protein-glutamate O-methyltransferase CheR [Polyangiaceae bacterium]
MSVAEFRSLRELVVEKTGIALGLENRATIERKLRERVVATGLTTFGEYVRFLRFGAGATAEWDEAIDRLTTNETYFFREAHALRALTEEVLPEILPRARSRGRLAVWSAGCSTGEEAYSIAIALDEADPRPPFDVRVHGSDLARRCVAEARRGVYGPSAFRATRPETRRRYFVDKPDGAHVVDSIKARCHFGQTNLVNEDKVRLVGRQDLIFCRNVLIYLDPHARKRVIDLFLERLYPGGVLFLGHSESLLNVSTAFELLHLREELAYRKPSRDLGQMGR